MTQGPAPQPCLDQVTLPEVLHALSDPLRLAILRGLGGGERGWGELEAAVSPSTLSHHLKVLRLAGLITHRREGTRCYVAIRPDLERRFPGLLAKVLELA